MNETQTPFESAKVVYILYLVGYLTGGLTVIAGLILAYMNDEQSGHTRFQVRTFWIGLLIMVIASICIATLVGALLGYPLLLFLFVWSLVRCISGLRLALDNKSVTGSGFMGFMAC